MKTYAQYLAENNNDPALAAQAMERDARAEIASQQAQVQGEISRSQSARAQARAFRKLADRLGLDTEVLDQEGLSGERRTEVLNDLIERTNAALLAATGDATDLAAALASAGFDVDAWRKAGKDRKAELVADFVKATKEGGAKAAELQQALNLRDAAADLGVDAKLLGNLKGSEGITRGKVKVEKTAEDGSKTTEEVDGWVVADGRALTQHIADLGFTVEKLAPAKQQEEQELDLGAPIAAGQKAASGKTDDFSWLK